MGGNANGKIDLRAEVHPGVSYRQIRDAFNRIGENFHPNTLGMAIWKDDIGRAYCRDTGNRRLPHLTEIFGLYHALEEGRILPAEYPRTAVAIRRSRKLAAGLCKTLEEQGLIQKYAHSPDRWEHTERAISLEAQKLPRRIPRQKAPSYLPRVIETAEQFNREEGPNYHITRIYLFGSLVRGVSDVGDIDLIVVVRKRFRCDSFAEWRKREIRRLEATRPSALWSFLPSTENEGPKRIGRLSPYVSVVAREDMLVQLKERSDPSQVIYAFNLPDATPQEAEEWRRDTERAEAFLRSLGLGLPKDM